jgi:hypothetical protein
MRVSDKVTGKEDKEARKHKGASLSKENIHYDKKLRQFG